MNGIEATVARWPGKSAPKDGIEHPAVLHMLDVAAVAERLIALLPAAEPLKAALTLLCALHDLGKVSNGFRTMLRGGPPQVCRHWEVTEALLWQHDTILAAALGSRESRRQMLYAATAGHHGRPSNRELQLNRSGSGPGGDWRAMLDAAGPEAEADAAEIIRAFGALWPEASLESLSDMAETKRLSWQLNGLLTVADWVGSNTGWFPPAPPSGDLARYLEGARAQAGVALDQAGLVGPPGRHGAAV